MRINNIEEIQFNEARKKFDQIYETIKQAIDQYLKNVWDDDDIINGITKDSCNRLEKYLHSIRNDIPKRKIIC